MIKRAVKSLITAAAGTLGWHLVKRGNKKLIILMYHRIMPESDPRYQFEEPGMVVSDKTFCMHMQTLQQEALPVMTVSEWVALPESDRPHVAVAITFDDGWLDNYEYAFPVLKEFGFSSTLYVVTDFLGQPAPFWPNKVLRLLLATREDLAKIEPILTLLGETPDFPVNRDQAAHYIHQLKSYDDKTIYAALASIKSESDVPREMISKGELLDAINTMGVEAGCHTRRHFRLTTALSSSQLEEEIVESKRILAEITGKPSTSFCFPNGDYSPEALSLVKQHYKNAVTTLRGHNNSNAVPHKLVRIGVHNDISNSPIRFKARLSGLV